jgi:hypothetical protein
LIAAISSGISVLRIDAEIDIWNFDTDVDSTTIR